MKYKRGLIERMFFYKDGTFSWTAFGAVNGYIMTWILFLRYVIYGMADEIVLSWSIGIIGLMVGIRPAQKGLQTLSAGISGKVRRKKDADSGDETEPEEDEITPPKEKVKVKPPSNPAKVKSGRWILLSDGKIIPLAEWQKSYGIGSDSVGKYFKLHERKFSYPNWVVSEYVIRVLDAVREELGEPIFVNSLYRENDSGAHGLGMGSDVGVKRVPSGTIDAQGKSETKPDEKDAIRKFNKIRDVASRLGINIRVNYTHYIARNLACVHFDVAPMYFASNKPYANMKLDDRRLRSFATPMVNGW